MKQITRWIGTTIAALLTASSIAHANPIETVQPDWHGECAEPTGKLKMVFDNRFTLIDQQYQDIVYRVLPQTNWDKESVMRRWKTDIDKLSVSMDGAARHLAARYPQCNFSYFLLPDDPNQTWGSKIEIPDGLGKCARPTALIKSRYNTEFAAIMEKPESANQKQEISKLTSDMIQFTKDYVARYPECDFSYFEKARSVQR